MIPTAYVERRKPTARITNYPAHGVTTAQPIPDQGDPFNPRNIVHEGDFYHVGKIRDDPGTHHNVYTNIPGIQAIAQKFWGQMFSKVDHVRGIRTPRGRAHTVSGISGDFNVQSPEAVSYGEFATIDGTPRQRIRSATL